MKASWSKLTSVGWGVRVVADEPFEELPEAGAEVTVRTKAGKESTVTVKSVVWSGETDGKYDTKPGQPTALYALD